ncbi:unnamed protein product, partial [Rotaria sp. Silwood1]
HHHHQPYLTNHQFIPTYGSSSNDHEHHFPLFSYKFNIHQQSRPPLPSPPPSSPPLPSPLLPSPPPSSPPPSPPLLPLPPPPPPPPQSVSSRVGNF